MRTIELILEDNKDYGTREAFNTLRTNILFSGRDVKTILITSSVAGEGKSTIAFETAVGLARTGKKVLLIDADLRKSAYASRYTKETGLTGLSQYLSGQLELDGVLFATQIPTLNVIFSGPFPPNPTELVGSSAFGELLNAEREHYDYILIDTPPLGLVIDAAVMATACDGAVLVVGAGTVSYHTAQRVTEQLKKSGCRILGAVLNRNRRGKHSKSKYYTSYYGKYAENQ
ncbi:MAG TPA: tyrosine protein kinase [Clostridiales bacterium]|nr:tyrosine protein kinase [Clostridiales bacterium]